MATNGRIHLLGDHRGPKSTKAEAQFEETKRIVEHYMVQIPPLMAQGIEAALQAYDAGRRDEFAAWVAARREVVAPIVADMLADLLAVFGPRKPMPEQPTVES